MMMQKIRLSHKPFIGLCILLLCLMTSIDDLNGFWQQCNTQVPIVQSAGIQGADDLKSRPLSTASAIVDEIDVSIYPSFSFFFLNKTQSNSTLVYLNSSRNRTPPSC